MQTEPISKIPNEKKDKALVGLLKIISISEASSQYSPPS